MRGHDHGYSQTKVPRLLQVVAFSDMHERANDQ